MRFMLLHSWSVSLFWLNKCFMKCLIFIFQHYHHQTEVDFILSWEKAYFPEKIKTTCSDSSVQKYVAAVIKHDMSHNLQNMSWQEDLHLCGSTLYHMTAPKNLDLSQNGKKIMGNYKWIKYTPLSSAFNLADDENREGSWILLYFIFIY